MKTMVSFLRITLLALFCFIAKQSKAQCAANFIWTLNSNGNVTYSSTSTISNSITTVYNWNFGSGIPSYTATGSSGMYPTYTYTANGNYTVSLFISSTSPSCSSSIVYTLSVNNVTCSLLANFAFTQGANGVVNFSNTSSGTSTTTSYFWSFGNGNTSSVTSPSTTYSANGTYVATLTANNNFTPSCISTKTLSINVTNICSLSANFFQPSSSSPGVFSFFNATTGTLTSTTYTWNFGNGSTSNSISPTSTFSLNGIYNVTLSASNNVTPACVSTTVIPITVPNICSLTPSFVYNTNGSGLYTFIGTGGNNAGYVAWAFMWGSSTNTTGGIVTNTSTFSATHTFTNGVYNVTLSVTNFTSSPGCNATTIQTILVNTNTCNVNANFSSILGSNGLVSFSNSSTGTSSTSVYAWNFGNGNTSNLFSPTITYTTNGIYNVTLTVSNSGSLSCSSTKTLALAVTNSSCFLTANFITSTTSFNVISYTNISTGTTGNTNYLWNFQNGASSNQFNPPPQTYTANGNYTTILTANNGTICSSSFSKIDTICSFVPAITFTQGINGNVTFSTNAVSANFVNAYWQFLNPNVNYNTAYGTVVTRTLSNGVYTPTLLVYYSPTCHKTVTTAITITNNPCSLVSSFSHTIGSNGLVNFLSTSSGVGIGTSFHWNFGDGWYSNGINPNHTYVNGGVHYVSLSLVDTTNGYCVSNSTMALNITGINCQANANFSVVPTATAQHWSAVLSYPYNITNAIWSWGDGATSNLLYASHQYSAAANYSICLSVTASCGSTATSCYTYNIYKGNQGSSNIISINVLPGKPELETGFLTRNFEEDFLFYPNPNTGQFILELPNLSMQNSRIEIQDLMGKLIWSDNTVQKRINIRINSSEIRTGVYILKVYLGEYVYTRKLIIQQ